MSDMNTQYDVSSSGVGMPGGFGGGWGGWGGGGMGGFGLVGLVGLNNLFDRDRRGGCDDSGSNHPIFAATVLNKLGTIEAAIPLASAATQAEVASVGASVKDTIQNFGLFTQQNFSNLLLAGQQAAAQGKDATQNALAIISAQNCETQNIVREVGCQIKQAIDAEGDSIKAIITAQRISELETQLAEARGHGRGRDTEINVSQVVSQVQAQAQQQQQQQAIWDGLRSLHCRMDGLSQWQSGRATAGSFQFGTGNLAANTPTNTNNQVG